MQLWQCDQVDVAEGSAEYEESETDGGYESDKFNKTSPSRVFFALIGEDGETEERTG